MKKIIFAAAILSVSIMTGCSLSFDGTDSSQPAENVQGSENAVTTQGTDTESEEAADPLEEAKDVAAMYLKAANAEFDQSMVKLMTEIELNEKITNLLSENPTQQKQSRRPYARENRVKKDDRLLRIIQRYYIPHAGYVDCGFDSTTLLHSGKYIKYPKHSHCQRWMKRLTSKKTRRCTDLVRKGNEYRRLFDYWWTLY